MNDPNPYRPPGDYGSAQDAHRSSGYAWSPLGWRTTTAAACIGATALAQLVIEVSNAMYRAGIDTHGVGLAASTVGNLVHLGAIIFFFVWSYTAAANARGLGVEQLEITPGWTIGWWFIPFANLVVPYRIIKEIWRSSDPEARRASPTDWLLRETSLLVSLWWGGMMMNQVVSFITLVTRKSGALTGELSQLFSGVAMTCRLVAAVCIILVMLDVNRRQTKQATILEAHTR